MWIDKKEYEALKKFADFHKNRADKYQEDKVGMIKDRYRYKKSIASKDALISELYDRIKQKKGAIYAHFKDKYDKRIEANRKKLAQANKRVVNVNYRGKKNREKMFEARGQLIKMKNNLAFWGKSMSWDDSVNKEKQLEIIIRAIVAYNQLVNDGYITYEEFMFLLIGSQTELFKIQDIESRCKMRAMKSKFNKCVEAGYFQRDGIKAKYHITIAGKNRLESIMKHIYTIKIGTQKSIAKVIEELI